MTENKETDKKETDKKETENKETENKETENKGRLVEDVLKIIMNIIPENEVELIKDLDSYDKSLFNKAPELRRSGECWIPFINILDLHIPNIVDEWHVKIRDILNNENSNND
jgi:hypothetical protein